jgi:hypothetical protein
MKTTNRKQLQYLTPPPPTETKDKKTYRMWNVNGMWNVRTLLAIYYYLS